MKSKLWITAMSLLVVSVGMSQFGMAQDWDMGTVKEEINGLKQKDSDFEQRLLTIEKKLNDWDFGTTETQDKPQPRELTNEEVIEIFSRHVVDVGKVWAEDESRSMREAATIWLHRKMDRDENYDWRKDPGEPMPAPEGLAKGGSNKGDSKECPCPEGGKCICPPGECDCPNCPIHHAGTVWKGNYPTFKGDEVVYFGADWCANCPAAVKRLGDLTKDVIYVDCTEKGGKGDTLAGMYMIDSYPAMIHIKDSFKVGSHQTEGDSVGSYLASQWLGKTPSQSTVARSNHDHDDMTSLREHLTEMHGYSRSQVERMTDSEVQEAHNGAHTTNTVRRSSPPVRVVRSSPPVRYSSPPRMSYGSSYSSGRSVRRLSGQNWTWPGNLAHHLSTVHGINPAGMSQAEMQTVHDNLHNTGQSGIMGGSSMSSSRSRYSSYQPPRQQTYYRPNVYFTSGPSYGGCPGGNCPR